jgi:hypothetical protein
VITDSIPFVKIVLDGTQNTRTIVNVLTESGAEVAPTADVDLYFAYNVSQALLDNLVGDGIAAYHIIEVNAKSTK